MLIRLINFLVRKYLDCDPEVAQRLSAFEDKNLLLRLTDMEKEFLVALRQDGITITEHSDDGPVEVAARVEADVLVLLRVARSKQCQSMLDDGTLFVQGDSGLVRQVGSVFAAVEIDWEEVAAAFAGDLPAYQVGVWLRRVKEYRHRSFENFRMDVSEYLQEESRVVPTRVEMERFLNDADELEASIGYLEARVRRLTEAH
ncbi:MAG: SCP2 sterol-binding domain-containing protein [Gammaproteobacteria bacterium]|nr:SCP2 sterol-binding domain-containing protein [Gammaproteobacteria bacterium]